jgi:opacity protein-like surface antigen
LGAILLCAMPIASAAQSGAWTFELTPYLWGSAMKGDVQSGSLPKTEVDMSFSDILDVFDFGAMGTFEARKDRWGVLVDGIYVKVSDAASARRTGPGPIGATLTADADIKLKQTILSAAATYRLVEGRSPVDLLGGLRYSRIDVDASIEGSLFARTRSVQRSGDKDWVDPYVGARFQHAMSDRWTLVGYGDVGGFGVGSDLTWQASLGVNYAFTKDVSAKLGYRYLSFDYDKNNFVYDMQLQGIYLGVGIRF